MLRIFRHHISLSTIVIALLESAALWVLLAAALQAGGTLLGLPAGTVGAQSTLITAIVAIGFLNMSAVGLYNRNSFFSTAGLFSRAVFSVVFSLVVLIAVIYLYVGRNGQYYYLYYYICMSALLIHALMVSLIRAVVLKIVNLGPFRCRVLVIGSGPLLDKIRALADLGACHFHLVDCLDVANVRDQEPAPAGPDVSPDTLSAVARRLRVDEIVVATREQRGLPVLQLLECKLSGIRITDFLSFWEREAQRIDLDELKPSWLIYSDGFRASVLRQGSKRAFDVVISLALLGLTLPMTMAAALAIRLDSRGPVFYRQERVGQGGRTFLVLKLRSMRQDAERQGTPQWAAADDDRITRIGGLLRRTRIDEIPQILNVLKGDMSFVGPRPERPFFVRSLGETIPFYHQRHRIKPGISGWAQINYPYGASVEDAKAKLSYDLYYVKNGGLFLDLVTLLQTVRVVLWPDGVR